MLLVIVLLSYLMGSISFAILISRWKGLNDPRDEGSHNPGASNLLDLGHKRLALLVLLGDSLKTIIPLLIGKSQGFNDAELAWLIAAASIGHMFPIFFNMRGGKGAASIFGGLVVLSPIVAFIAFLVWVGVFTVTRYAILASLFAIISILISSTVFCAPSTHMPIAFIVGLLMARYHGNWPRLLQGREPKRQILDHL